MTLKKIAEDKSQTAIDIKKVTDYAMNPLHIEIEPGFNARDMVNMTAKVRKHVDALKQAIRSGITLPALDVKHVGDHVYVRDGHCRLTAMKELIAEGLEIMYCAVREFRGNDAEQFAHVLDTDEKGLSVTRLEHGRQLAKMRSLGWTSKMLAERFRKSESYILQNLTLADANTDVRVLLDAETISAKVALDAIRKHGEKAGAVLTAALAGTKSGRLTGASVTRGLPPKAVKHMTTSLLTFVATLPPTLPKSLEYMRDDVPVTVTAGALRALLAAHAEIAPTEAV